MTTKGLHIKKTQQNYFKNIRTFYFHVFQIKEMMARAGNSHLLTVLSYPNAGHLIEPPYTPHARSSTLKTVEIEEKGRFTFTLQGCRLSQLFFEDQRGPHFGRFENVI